MSIDQVLCKKLPINYNLIDQKINIYFSFKNIFFISIQHGISNKFYDLPGHAQLKNLAVKDLLSCDCMFVFGQAYKDFISKYIKSKFVIFGSYFNNFQKKFELNNNQKKILIISQFRDKNQ